MKILGTGSALPKHTVTNDMLSEYVDTSDEWITTRTGIKSRQIITNERFEDIAALAGQRAIEAAGLVPEDIDFIICSNVVNCYVTPSLASLVQGILGIKGPNCPTMDINSACAGFVYGLDICDAFLQTGRANRILYICAEEVTRMVDWTQRETCVLFGDGAAAAVLSLREDGQDFFIGGTQPDDTAITVPAFTPEGGAPGIGMEGQKVFKFACGVIEENINKLVDISGLSLDEIDHVVCHQANARIINHTIKHLKADPAKFFMNIEEFGNTSAASIPIALAQMSEEGLLKRGDKVMLVGFGAGLVHGGMLFTW